ncbi:MAG: heme-binding Shp domain-containing protein [bacterium]|nr:heme-binding Shp domain-containing protein [bacterium]
MKHYSKYIISLCLVAVMFLSIGNTTVMAMSDGAYTVSVSYSYKNPETNETEDGGSNIALGESMIASMLEKQALVEQVNGKTYVTIGIGLMSNVSSVKIQTQSSKGGSYKTVSSTKTGSSTNNGDTVNHYRFQVSNTGYYISPKVFIDPMGREVQFFIKLDMGTAKSGTGIYTSEMAVTAKATATPAAKKTAAPTKTTAPKQTETATAPTAPTASAKTEQQASAKPTEQVTSTTAPTAEAKTTNKPQATEVPEDSESLESGETMAPEAEATADASIEPTKEAEMQAATETPAVVEADVDGGTNVVAIFAIAVIVISIVGSGVLLVLNKKGRKND